MKEEEIIQAGIDYTLSTNPKCIAGDNFGNFSMTMNRNPSFEAGAKWMQEKMIDKACEWIDKESFGYIYDNEPYLQPEFKNDFKKAMKQ